MKKTFRKILSMLLIELVVSVALTILGSLFYILIYRVNREFVYANYHPLNHIESNWKTDDEAIGFSIKDDSSKQTGWIIVDGETMPLDFYFGYSYQPGTGIDYSNDPDHSSIWDDVIIEKDTFIIECRYSGLDFFKKGNLLVFQRTKE